MDAVRARKNQSFPPEERRCENGIRKWHQSCAGAALAEVMVGVAVVFIAGAGAFSGLNSFNRTAAETRVSGNAKSIVQERIDMALTLDFDPDGSPPFVPAVLETGTRTSAAPILLDENGLAVITGTVSETVSAVSNPSGLDIRMLSVRIDYSYGGRDFDYTISTIRAPDS